MQTESTNLIKWQKKFNTETSCSDHLIQLRWADGFICPKCNHNHGYYNSNRVHFECASCHKQTSVICGTIFHGSKVSLLKWFWAIFYISSDKGGISALRLSKLISVSWKTAFHLLRKIRKAMGDQDSIYSLGGTVELDDTYIGGKRAGKRGRGAGGKASVLVACENHDGYPRYIAMKVIRSVSKKEIELFTKENIKPTATVRTDGYPSNNGVNGHAKLEKKVTPPEFVDEWLPWVHVAMANLKRFILGTFHGTSRVYIQKYLNEFCYRFNRRFWEGQIPLRLLTLCANHTKVSLT